MKERLRNNKGITLIALVVTIIVLIILAVISINLVFGQDGIIARAEKARDLERAASVEEAVELWKTNNKVAKYTKEGTQSREDLLKQLVTDGLITSEEKEIIEQAGTITIGEKTITIEESTARTLVEMYDAGELKIGDYVNYANPTSGETIIYGTDSGMQDAKNNGVDVNGVDVLDEQLNQVYKVANNQVNWRVLGKDETTGGIKLIGSPLKKETTNNDPYLYMYGAKLYVNGINLLTNICGMYKNNLAEEARSVNMKDIDQAVGITDEDTIKEKNILAAMGAKQYGETYNFENQYTPESWLNGRMKTTVSGTVNGYAYAINCKEDGIPTLNVNDKINNLLFNNVELETGACYWLASRGVNAVNYEMWFDSGLVATGGDIPFIWAGVGSLSGAFCSSEGNEGRCGLAVRPVVILKYDITEDDIQKIADKTEEVWNYEK